MPYDGRLTRADGKGTWWEGLDPQQLYCKLVVPIADDGWGLAGAETALAGIVAWCFARPLTLPGTPGETASAAEVAQESLAP